MNSVQKGAKQQEGGGLEMAFIGNRLKAVISFPPPPILCFELQAYMFSSFGALYPWTLIGGGVLNKEMLNVNCASFGGKRYWNGGWKKKKKRARLL